MFLTYGDLAKLFPIYRGIQMEDLPFHTVATSSSLPQTKGIYIPLHEDPENLKLAIENGAIAALWKENTSLPRYVPTYFPMFITNDLVKGLKDMMELYANKIIKSNLAEKNMTNFLFLDEIRLKECKETYDIAVMLERLQDVSFKLRIGEEEEK